MDLSTRVLGSTAANKLREQDAEAIFVIGKDRLTRAQLATVGCFNFTAARNFSRAAAALGAKSLRDLYDSYPPSALALPRVGTISLAVLGAAFEARHICGDAPLEQYVQRHAEKVTTFETIKHREQREAARERTARRRARRRTAHAPTPTVTSDTTSV